MKNIFIGLFLLWSIGNLIAQNDSRQIKDVIQFFYRDSVVSMQQWYNTNNVLDSVKTYHKTGELDESVYFRNKKIYGTCLKHNQKGDLVTTWKFDDGQLIKRTDYILEFTKQNEEKIIQFHTDLVAVNLALKETPNKTSLIAKRARIRTNLNNHILAIHDYILLINRLLKLSEKRKTPPPPQLLGSAYSAVATNYEALEMDGLAIQYKLKAMESAPGNTRLIYNFSSFLYGINAYELALYYANKVIAIKPEHSFANNLLAAIYTDYEDYDKALYCINIAFKNEASLLKNGYGTEEQDLRTQRGFILHKLGKSDEGIADLKEALRLNENNSFAYRNLGVVYYDLANYNLACKNLKQAKTLGYQKIHGKKDLQIYLDYSCKFMQKENLGKADEITPPTIKLRTPLSIYPTLTKDIITIKNLDSKAYDYSILDYEGTLIKQGTNKEPTISVSDLPNGFYILILSPENSSKTELIIIKE